MNEMSLEEQVVRFEAMLNITTQQRNASADNVAQIAADLAVAQSKIKELTAQINLQPSGDRIAAE